MQKSVIIIALATFAIGGIAAVRAPKIVVPPPEVILAEENAVLAANRLLEMQYRASASIYNDALVHLPNEQMHKRLYARSLIHLGYWEEAAENLILATADTEIKTAVERDLERLRALQAGKTALSTTRGRWQPVELSFGQNMGVGPTAVLSNGIIVTGQPSEGSVVFWAPSGRREGTVYGVGVPAGLVADGDAVLVADMAGDRILRVAASGILSVSTLTGVHGTRNVDVGPIDGSVWLTDFGNGRAVRVSREGQFITQAGIDPIGGPTSLLRIGQDLLVSESERDRVRRYDSNGRFIRHYTHKSLKSPAALARTEEGFLVQGSDGLLFAGTDTGAELTGPLPGFSHVLITSRFGVASDKDGNLWWGDGRSLRLARRIPADAPQHILEILNIRAFPSEGRGAVVATAAVISKDGKPIETLAEHDFRLIKEDTRLLPIRVENLSRTLSGRRITIVSESSDALWAHEESLKHAMEYLFGSLTAVDKVSVIDVTDTFRTIRDFTVSPELIRRALFEPRPRVATIDVAPAFGLDYAIRTLAPTDYARAIVWITSGEGLNDTNALILERMGIVNQVPIFIVHVGERNEDLLASMASKTNGEYFRLYGTPSPANLGNKLAQIKSGRYRISARIDAPSPDIRGHWVNLTLESYYLSEGTFDRVGYYSF